MGMGGGKNGGAAPKPPMDPDMLAAARRAAMSGQVFNRREYQLNTILGKNLNGTNTPNGTTGTLGA